MANEFEKSLLASIRGYAGYVTKLAKQFSESRRVRQTIKSSVTLKNLIATITTVAGGINARDARAREYGSGLHSQLGVKKKITIKPKNAGALVFPWQKANDYIPRTKDGRVILKKVEHPGIEADNNGKGYMRPAQDMAVERLSENLAKKGAEGIKVELVNAFKVK